MTPMMGVWLCNALWDHYEFRPDPDYLKQIYPLLKGAAQFCLDYMIKDPEHKWLITSPSASPENEFLTPDERHVKTAVCRGPTLDAQLIRDLFLHCGEATRILGVDARFRKQLEKSMNVLPPTRVGKHGQIMEWLEDVDENEVTHRHLSPLYGFYPSNQMTLRGTPELARAVRTTLERRGDDNRGWSGAWKVNLWARLHEPERAYDVLQRMLSDISIHPQEEDSDRVPSMEGNQGIQGVTASIAEMLLQSHAGEIEILPALPQAWPSGNVRGLRARGGVEVDVMWQDSRLKYAVLRPSSTAVLRVRVPQEKKIVAIKNNGLPCEMQMRTDGSIDIKALAGHRYELYAN